MNNTAHRLAQFISSQKMSVIQFETEIEVSKGVVAKAVKNGTGFNISVAEKIGEKFPHLNLNWLFTGNGSMFNETEAQQVFMPAVAPVPMPVAAPDNESRYYQQKLEELNKKYIAVLEDYARCMKEKEAQKTVAVGRATH
ncbi:hypothetical protein [Phnomibacter sp. MR]|uniref:hypothetical protein n=1 Tax=Phnomibacter sp. MR TaxID=3042318 RepID=UPI003A7FF262